MLERLGLFGVTLFAGIDMQRDDGMAIFKYLVSEALCRFVTVTLGCLSSDLVLLMGTEPRVVANSRVEPTRQIGNRSLSLEEERGIGQNLLKLALGQMAEVGPDREPILGFAA